MREKELKKGKADCTKKAFGGDYFLAPSELAELKRLNPYYTTIGEVLELAFSDMPKPLLQLGRQYEWYNKTVREARSVDLFYAFNFIRYHLSLFFAAEQRWGMVKIGR